MKYLLVLTLATLIGCNNHKTPLSNPTTAAKITPKPLPRAVHNTCIDMWAVKTEDENHDGWSNHPDQYWGKYFISDDARRNYNYPDNGDSVEYAKLGDELQFKDSATAMKTYHDFVYRRDRPKQIADSIFKCKHTYQ